MDPIKIPQNVYVEDRIIGSLTLRQIIIVIIGGGVSYIFYSYMQKTYGYVSIPFMIFSAIPLLISIAFAFVRIHDLSLLKLILLLIERSSKPNVRTWSPRSGITIVIKTERITKETHHAHRESAEEIQKLSTLLDTLPPKPPEEQEENLPPQPVNPTAIKAEPLTNAIDQPIRSTRPSVSIFKSFPPPAAWLTMVTPYRRNKRQTMRIHRTISNLEKPSAPRSTAKRTYSSISLLPKYAMIPYS